MKVSPSLISAKLEFMADEIEKCHAGGASSFHLDVMDGAFVPNLTMGPDLVRAIRRCTSLNLECHLMLERPDKYYRSFFDAGGNIMLIHVESPISTGHLLKEMKDQGIPYGVVINPETRFDMAKPFLEDAGILLIMSVHPGFSGQKFIPDSILKVKEARKYIDENGLRVEIEVDGGINLENAAACRNAGADIVVSASYIFSENVLERVSGLRDL